MAIYGNFASPILGMLTQSASFGAISQNITNVNTGGYKAIDTRFSTVLAKNFDNNSDIGGVRAIRKNLISQQGNTISSTLNTDVAINGQGFITLNTELDGTGEQLYTRDGAFQLKKGEDVSVSGVFRGDGSFDITGATPGTPQTFSSQKAFLADKNGHYVQGLLPDGNGNFNATGPLVPVRLDRFAFISDAAATSTATVAGNLPATDTAGTVETMKATVYDSVGALKSIELQWTRGTQPQEWTLEVVPTDGTNTTVDADGLPAPTETFSFGTDGKLAPGTTHSFEITWDDSLVNNIDLDISNISSISGNFAFNQFDKDGRTPGDLDSFSFDPNGRINGVFTNGVTRALYELPLATFVNPDGLEVRQGNLFAQSVDSGDVTLREAGVGQFGEFVPFATELSNTNLQNEFTRMIMAQKAYNLSGSVFKSVDEMTQEAAELKS